MNGFWPIHSLWWREILRFLRQRSRVTGSLLQPLLFWVLLGAGLHASFRPPGVPAGTDYTEYLYPGIIALALLFTAIFSTISTIQDRNEGFLQGVLAAPVSRSGIVVGQALGGTTLALIQGVILLALAPLAGVPLSLRASVGSLSVMAVLSFGFTGLGLAIAWKMDSVQGFHAIMNLLLMPLWLLSGAVFPVQGAAGWLGWIMRVNPVTYGVAALRRVLYLEAPGAVGFVPPFWLSMAALAAFSCLMFAFAVWNARHRPV